jgi:integral membrane protein
LALLIIAVPLKHIAGWDFAVKILGPLHGLAFLIYTWLAINIVTTANGNWKEIAQYIGLAIVPLGGFFGAAKLAQKSAHWKEGHNV